MDDLLPSASFSPQLAVAGGSLFKTVQFWRQRWIHVASPESKSRDKWILAAEKRPFFYRVRNACRSAATSRRIGATE
ncbi:hypothetical protein MRB53_019881 [Persea americana]|uniref:Uncharacterized protein n=1 Tax=Persea americana TaxID=3435 RepID=A0ACC2KZA8_PERAE|nr:hypothetical protein MRB53_019881 [Persea americana]